MKFPLWNDKTNSSSKYDFHKVLFTSWLCLNHRYDVHMVYNWIAANQIKIYWRIIYLSVTNIIIWYLCYYLDRLSRPDFSSNLLVKDTQKECMEFKNDTQQIALIGLLIELCFDTIEPLMVIITLWNRVFFLTSIIICTIFKLL